MSYTRVKTTYSVMGAFGSTDTEELYCIHNHGCDAVTFYDNNGAVTSMDFNEWDAMNRLWYPFKEEWGGELKQGVEYFSKPPWK